MVIVDRITTLGLTDQQWEAVNSRLAYPVEIHVDDLVEDAQITRRDALAIMLTLITVAPDAGQLHWAIYHQCAPDDVMSTAPYGETTLSDMSCSFCGAWVTRDMMMLDVIYESHGDIVFDA